MKAQIGTSFLIGVLFVAPNARAATFTVTKTTDSGAGTFRQAILDANSSAGVDSIVFNITTGGAGVKTITPATPLPPIIYPVIIDGTTQSGYNGTSPVIQLSGASAGAAIGLELRGGSSLIRGLAINAFQFPGIVLYTNGNNVIDRNFIGINPSGTLAQGNGVPSISDGIAVWCSGNVISNNVISGNGRYGVGIIQTLAISNRVEGNFIGTDRLGLAAVPNLAGIGILNSAFNLVGGTSPAARNVVSGNTLEGIEIVGQFASSNLVQGNLVGLNVSGQAALPNGTIGILLSTSADFPIPASANLIGGTVAGAGNFISGNGSDGIQIGFGSWGNLIANNTIGLSATLSTLGNGRHGVAIFDSPSNRIGALSAANWISANASNGVLITSGTLGTGSTSNLVQNNAVGIGGGNGGAGIFIKNSSGNWIGGNIPQEGNSIARNGASVQKQGHGVVVESGTNNPVLSNLIWENHGRAIDLGNNSFTLNDVTNHGSYDNPVVVFDSDEGANHLQNYPVVTRVRFDLLGRKWITWTLNSRPLTIFRIDFFSSPTLHRSGFGNAEKWLNFQFVVTDGAGTVSFTNEFSSAEAYITTTATDTDTFNTSEMSPNDSDGDGIPDAWELFGVDFNENSLVDFHPLFANPYIKDVFVEIDAMSGQAPDMANLSRVVTGNPGMGDGFNNAPWELVQNVPINGIGQDGIHLHLELSDTDLPKATWDNDDYGYLEDLKAGWFGVPHERTSPNAANILAAKRLFYRYCLFADHIVGTNSATTGRGQIGGNDFFLTKGTNSASADSDAVPGTFMHELGHTLGLLHGGSDGVNLKPNYHSVMNYAWVDSAWYNKTNGWTLDYSRVAFSDLHETNLNEQVGLSVPASHSGHQIPAGPAKINGITVGPNLVTEGTANIDWNLNTTFDALPSVADINYWGGDPPSPGQLLKGSEDWSGLQFYFLESHAAAKARHPDDRPNDLPITFLEEKDSVGAGPGVFQFQSTALSLSETSGVATIVVKRIFQQTNAVSVAFTTLSGTATGGSDFGMTNGTLTFGPAESFKSFNVSILNDTTAELPETISLVLSDPSPGCILGPRSRVTFTILDDDSPVHYTVINTNDSGSGSLRQAMLDANTNVGIAIIDFNIPGSSGLTISPASALPGLFNTVILDGTTQPGFVGAPIIELNGASAGATDGLVIVSSRSVVRGLVINRFSGSGIRITTQSHNVIEGCYLGLSRSGTLDQGNTVDGIQVFGGYSNIIGGVSLAARNFIAGNNNYGIQINGTNNLILGNVIGLGVDDSDQGNSLQGILLNGQGNIVGGDQPGARNVISGNDRDGIAIIANNNRVLGNYIGTTLDGLAARANRSNGIAISAAANITIGGDDPDGANLISGNGRYGIGLSSAVAAIIQRNRIGLGATGEVAVVNQLGGILVSGSSLRNRIGDPVPTGGNIIGVNFASGIYIQSNFSSNNVIRGNQIFNFGANVGYLGIDLYDEGPNSNDSGDLDAGANGLQNSPILTEASNSINGTVIVGELNSRPNTNYMIDFYVNKVPDLMGRFWIGSTNVTTDSAGNVAFTATSSAVYLLGQYITATATDGAGNTSEFCAPVAATSSLPGITLTVTNANDAGPGSLRQAILDSNGHFSGLNTIEFNIPMPGVQTIQPLAPLPALTMPVLINGYTQPGSVSNSAANGDNGVRLIELDGTLAGATYGLRIRGGNSIVRGLVINRFGTGPNSFEQVGGLEISARGGNRIEGNLIGTDATGTLDRGNFVAAIFVNGSSNNVIGGVSSDQRNVISATKLIPFGDGAFMPGNGILFSSLARGVRVEGNYIGTAANGITSLGNASFGIEFNTGAAATNLTIGGTLPGSGNVIAYNGRTFPVLLVPQYGGGIGNLADAPGTAVLGNSIHSNVGLGIQGDLCNSRDGRGNFPLLSAATSSNGLTTVQGRLHSVSNAPHRVEFFSNDALDPSSHGEGRVFLGWTNVTTDTSGFVAFTAVLPAAVTNGQFLTATATDDRNYTSEFSPRLGIGDVLTNVIVVNSINDVDDGFANAAHTSLREAIIAANNHSGPDTIRFAIGSGPRTISVSNSPPALLDGATTLDATTQPGYVGLPLIYLDGMSLSPAGFRLYSPSNTIRGFAINRFTTAGIYGDGIFASPHGRFNVVEANYVGTDRTGSGATGIQVTGIMLNQGSASNRIGGASVAARNVISGNRQFGIDIWLSDGNVIQGNFVGTGPAGTNAVGNGVMAYPSVGKGIRLFQSRGTIIGGGTPTLRNVISANEDSQISISADCSGSIVEGNYIGTDVTSRTNLGGPSPILIEGEPGGILIRGNVLTGSSGLASIYLNGSSNRVEGNFIGTDATGTNAVPGLQRGISIEFARTGNVIGGTNAEARNIIGGGSYGIVIRGQSNIVQGNFIGTKADGTTSLGQTIAGVLLDNSFNQVGGREVGQGNTVAFSGGPGIAVVSGSSNAVFGNSIFANIGLGIDLGQDGVTANDVLDPDAGANNLQNFPILTSVRTLGSTTLIQGTLNSRSNAIYRIEFFSNPTCHSSGYGEGRNFITSALVTTDSSGNANIHTSHPQSVPVGQFLTATATDAGGATSEFAPCVLVTLETNSVTLTFSAAAPQSLSWPTTAADFVLQRATNLAAPVYWEVISYGIVTNAELKSFTFTNDVYSGSPRFYRLFKP
jgi:hypothetical protein